MAAGAATHVRRCAKYQLLTGYYILTLIILLSGDVETNPGPPKKQNPKGKADFEQVDDENIVDILREVCREMKELKASVHGNVSTLTETVNKLTEELQEMKEINSQLAEENKGLKKVVMKLEEKTDSLENASKQNNIVMSGLDIQATDNPKDIKEKER
ncbi:hypothetical protein SNE40_009835 [Patella caerulea]|uniref:Uncharacterized protein n=1 Tax=Patella caerulea TaxID=87958 RepID=A0AAN8JQG5_PATCE